MWAIRWSAHEQETALLVPEQRVARAVAGAKLDLERAVRELHPLAVAELPGHVRPRAPGAEAPRDAPQRDRQVLRDPVAAHQRDRELVLELHVLVVALDERRQDVDRRDLGARAGDEDLDQAEVVDVLVADQDQLEVLDRVPGVFELVLELVERLARVRPGVEERQRRVLDQVAVHPADRERSRDPQPVDAGLGRGAPGPRRAVKSGSGPTPRRAAAPCPRARRATRG